MINWLEKNYKISWTITIILALIIFYISSLTFGTGYAGGNNLNATLYHFGAFFLLAFFFLISITKGKPKYSLFFVGIISTIAYGVLDEIHQFFIPGRFSSIPDVVWNSTGILLASLTYLILIKWRLKK